MLAHFKYGPFDGHSQWVNLEIDELLDYMKLPVSRAIIACIAGDKVIPNVQPVKAIACYWLQERVNDDVYYTFHGYMRNDGIDFEKFINRIVDAWKAQA